MEVLNVIIDVITAIAKAVMGFLGDIVDTITAIPEFVNNNQGVIAVLAILVAVYVAKIPYKKKITIYSGLDYDDEQGNYSIVLYLYNAGHVSLCLKHVEVNQVSKRGKRKNNWPCNIWDLNENDRFLEPQKMYYYPLGKLECVKGQEENTDLLIIITTEEKTFKKRIGWAVG